MGLESPQPGAPRCSDSRADPARERPTHQTGRPTAWKGSSEQQSEATAPFLQEHPALRGRAGAIRPEVFD